MTDYKNYKILFICLGNICRSPMAEGVMKNLLKKHANLNWEIDSAALAGYHVGKLAEERCLKVLGEHGITLDHRVRTIKKDDFEKFNFIFGMDNDNMHELNRLAPKNSKAQILLLGSYGDPNDIIIEDPYYESGDAAFRKCYDQIILSCTNFIESTLKNQK